MNYDEFFRRLKLNKKIGLVNGCFDVLHIGHIRLFDFAKSNCDFLFVAIDSDEMIKKSKGPDRPFNNQQDRQEMLNALKSVFEVIIFNSHDELIEICKKLNADVHIVGAEYKDKYVVGGEYAKKLIFFDRIGEYSTSKILNDV